MSESRNVVGYIDPIPAEALFGLGVKKVETPPPPKVLFESKVPILYPHIHRVQLKSVSPIKVEDSSIEYARGVAERVVAGLEHMPHTPEAGELLALAFAVLHFAGERK